MAEKQIKILRDMVYSSRPYSAGSVVNTDTDLKECRLALSSGWAAILPDKIEKTVKKRGKKAVKKAVESECF